MSVRPSMRCAVPATCSGAMYARGAGDDAQLAAARPRLVEAEPEVHEDRAAVRREDDVRRLDVAVDDEPGVGVGQGIGHGGRDAGRLRPGSGGCRFSHSAEVGAVEIIRDDVHLPLVQADVVDRHDAGVAQPGEPAGLLEESLGLGVRHVGAAAQDLDGHGPVELRVVAEVHRAEAAGSQGVPHLVAAEGGGRGRGDPLRRRLGRRARRMVRGQIRLAPRLQWADGRAWKRGIRLHGDIARGLVWVGLACRVQFRLLLASRGISSRRSTEAPAARPGIQLYPRVRPWPTAPLHALSHVSVG